MKRGPKPRLTEIVNLKPPRAPAHLTPVAADEFRAMVKLLKPRRNLTDADGRALAIYAETYARWLTAKDKLAMSGEIIPAPTGYPMQNPWLAIARAAERDMTDLLIQFGMTPVSRRRAMANVAKSPASRPEKQPEQPAVLRIAE